MNANIPNVNCKRVVIVGGGFAGLNLARRLINSDLQIVMIDKNNYHQFQPLFYQVSASGLEPSAILFPFRKIFQKKNNFFFRLGEVKEILSEKNEIVTSIGNIKYDYLVLAAGTVSNYFGMKNAEQFTVPMKSVSDSIYLRDRLLMNFERAVIETDSTIRESLLNVVIVGGGATGVEIAGAISEMKRYVIPKDYPNFDISKMKVYLIEGGDRLLAGMSEKASFKALHFLKHMGVDVQLKTFVRDCSFDGVILDNHNSIRSNTVIWASGVFATHFEGLSNEVFGKGGRIKTDHFNRIIGFEDIFAIGDLSIQSYDKYPNGHPQVAQVAIQQGKLLAKNLIKFSEGKPMFPFLYKNKGSMATIGRNKAVADIGCFKLSGFFAWIVWMLVHLMSILGVKNKIVTLLEWTWSYFTYDHSLRLIIKPVNRKI